MRLIIKRKGTIFGCAVPYRIKINGQEVGKVYNGKTVAVACPDTMFELRLEIYGNSLNIRSFDGHMVIDPRQSRTGDIFVDAYTDVNAIGWLTFGICAPTGTIKLYVRYA